MAGSHQARRHLDAGGGGGVALVTGAMQWSGLAVSEQTGALTMPKALLAPAPHLQCLPSSGQALNLRTSLQEDFRDISIGNDLRAPTSCSHPQFLVSRAFFSPNPLYARRSKPGFVHCGIPSTQQALGETRSLTKTLPGRCQVTFTWNSQPQWIFPAWLPRMIQ